MSAPLPVTDRTFEAEVLRADQPVLVGIWVSSCGPCRHTRRSFEQLRGVHGTRVRFVTLDADANPTTLARYGVLSLPTIQVFLAGRLVKTITGPQSPASLERQITDLLHGTASDHSMT